MKRVDAPSWPSPPSRCCATAGNQRDANIRQPLARSGPILNRLAQGQALAVLEGTAIPYKLATLAEPGAIEGGIAELLSAERKVALHGGDEGLHPGLGHRP